MPFSWFFGVSPEVSSFATIGEWGEAYAAYQLRRSGLELIARNKRYRCGELDLVVGRRRWFWIVELIFCEVKTRRSRGIRAAEAVTRAKQQRLQRAARRFLYEWQREGTREGGKLSCRFDVVEIYSIEGQIEFRWNKNAFDADPELFLF